MTFRERRKGKDSILYGVTILAVIGWTLLLIALFIIDKASPQDIEFYFNFVDTGVHSGAGATTWNEHLLRIVFYIMILGMCLSGVGLYLNSKRNRRRNDSYYLSLIFLGIVSTIGTLYLLI